MTSNLSDVIPAWIASVIFKASFVIYFHVTVYSSSFVETFHRFRGEKIGYASSMVRSLGAIIVLLVSKSYATNFCVSRVVSNNIARAGISPNRIFTTSNGVDLNHINSIKPLSSKIYDAAFLGRVEPNKGIHDLLKAWKKVVDEGDRKLLVIGSGSYLENAIKVSKELRLSKHVIFVGRVNENDKYRLLKSSKLLVFPTLASEGWGLVAIEALACGLPVICYDNPALVSVLGNCECAFFTPTGDIQKLAATINRVLSAQKMLESWSFLAKAYATNFDIDAVAKREFELLMSISKSLPRKIE
jgi:glycosyltransferase involved in cell wall biosynthesis